MNVWRDSSFILLPSSLLIALPHDPSAQWIQSLLDPLVSAIDLMNVVDHALALGAERGQQQGHSGADVGAGDVRAGESIPADDDGAMRITENDARTHGDQLVGEEEPRLEHLFENHDRSLGLRGQN